MSSEIHKHVETSIEKKQNLFRAEVISFPNEKNNNKFESLEVNDRNFWKISDKSNEDQLRAITGICFMLGVLILLGLYFVLFFVFLFYLPISRICYVIQLNTSSFFNYFFFFHSMPCVWSTSK